MGDKFQTSGSHPRLPSRRQPESSLKTEGSRVGETESAKLWALRATVPETTSFLLIAWNRQADKRAGRGIAPPGFARWTAGEVNLGERSKTTE